MWGGGRRKERRTGVSPLFRAKEAIIASNLRGFSLQNLIKTKHRSKLATSTLDMLMRVHLLGVSFAQMEQQWSAIYKVWLTARSYRWLESNNKRRNGGSSYHINKGNEAAETAALAAAAVAARAGENLAAEPALETFQEEPIEGEEELIAVFEAFGCMDV